MRKALRSILYGGAGVLLAGLGVALARSLREPRRATLRETRRGSFVDATPPSGASSELGKPVSEMAPGLSARNEELEALVEQRTAELQAALEQARSANSECQKLLARSNRQLEDERKRIAADFHDHLNAALIALRLQAHHIAAVSADMNGEAAHEVHVAATKIADSIASLSETARDLIKQLRPEIIDVSGLSAALKGMIHEYNRLVPGTVFTWQMSPAFPIVRGQLAMVAYRLVQESLSNIVKHSSARQVEVVLAASPSSTEFLIAVHDDGIGFDPAKVPEGSFGLAGMRGRVIGAGGRMRIRSTPGRGTRLTFRLPLVDCGGEAN